MMMTCLASGCSNPATCVIVAEKLGGDPDKYRACDSCAAQVEGCDGVTIVRSGGEGDPK